MEKRERLDVRRCQQLLGLLIQMWEERRKEWDGEGVAVEEVFVPMRTVFGIGELDVETHYR